MLMRVTPHALEIKPSSMCIEHQNDVLNDLHSLQNHGCIMVDEKPDKWVVSASEGCLYSLIYRLARTYDIEVV